MHDGCGGNFEDGKAVINKLRMMGFSSGPLPAAFSMKCHHCDKEMEMTTYEFACPHCSAIHGVTPCHSFSADHVQCAGVDY